MTYQDFVLMLTAFFVGMLVGGEIEASMASRKKEAKR